MPWCSHCDEVFPEGPSCPRCRTTLTDPPHAAGAEDSLPPGALPQLKVPRRLRRAFAGPSPQQPRPLVALGVAVVLLAGGFVIGRLSGTPVEGPAVRPVAAPGLRVQASGSVVLARRGHGLLGFDLELQRNVLAEGTIATWHRMHAPFSPGSAGMDAIRLSGLGGSVAVTVEPAGRPPAIAAFPATRGPLQWLDGDEAAWESRETLLVREGDSVTRWRFSDGVTSEPIAGSFRRVLPTPTGAALEQSGEGQRTLAMMSAAGPVPVLALPAEASLLAAAGDARAALIVSPAGAELLTEQARTRLRIDDAYDAVGAAFDPSGQRVAVVLEQRGRRPALLLAVFDAQGDRVMLRPLRDGDAERCAPVPSWHASGRWVMVAPGDGSVKAIEVGGVVTHARLRAAGCAVVWTG